MAQTRRNGQQTVARSSTSFRPGQSGNPSGRPKVVAEVQELAREHTAEAVGTLVEIMQDKSKPAAARVSAANAVLDRGYGKATQPIDTGGKAAKEMTDAERDARIMELLNIKNAGKQADEWSRQDLVTLLGTNQSSPGDTN